MVQDSEPETDSDLRRRAAWLLGMLAVVAVLFIVLLSQLSGTDGKTSSGGPRDLDSAVGGHPSTSTASSSHARTQTRTPPARSAGGSTTSAVTGTKCPTRQTCILDGDPGNGIAAINAYRTQNGRDAVPGRVTAKAQQCAFRNGNGCNGGWAETELPKVDGAAAVQKILPFAHLLDPNMKGVQVGWAYDPRAKLYYFAIIRND